MQLAQIKEELNNTSSNNAYPRFSCNYSFLAANSFYIIPAKPQETSLNSYQVASVSADATGDPVNSWDPSGLTCQDVQQAVVQADNLHIQMDQASINALNRTCTHTMALNNLLIQGNEQSAQMPSAQPIAVSHCGGTTQNILDTFDPYSQCNEFYQNAQHNGAFSRYVKSNNPVYQYYANKYISHHPFSCLALESRNTIYPNFEDPTQPPGPGWEWKGTGPPESGRGAWYDPSTDQSLHPDLNHPNPKGPHYDYRGPDTDGRDVHLSRRPCTQFEALDRRRPRRCRRGLRA